MLTVHWIRGMISNFTTGALAVAMASSAIVGAARAADPEQPASRIGDLYERRWPDVLRAQRHAAGRCRAAIAAARHRDPVRYVGQPNRRVSRNGARRARSRAWRSSIRTIACNCSRPIWKPAPSRKEFLAAGSPELKAAVQSLRNESPLGSTDMEDVLRAAASKFDKDRPEGRVAHSTSAMD